jgi:hypothetical protein
VNGKWESKVFREPKRQRLAISGWRLVKVAVIDANISKRQIGYKPLSGW